MDNNNKKIITVSFLIAGALVAFVLGLLMDAFAGSFIAVARVVSNDFVRHVLPVIIGIITFAILQFNPKTVKFADEVVTELKKVVWPSQRDTIAMTIVVCIMLVLSGVLFGVFDFASSYVVNWLVNQ